MILKNSREQPREARTLIFSDPILSARSDLKRKQKSADNALFLRSVLAMQDRISEIGVLASPGPRRPDILKTLGVVNLLFVVNLLRVAIHNRKCSESLHFVLIYSSSSSESLCVVISLQRSNPY